MSKGGRIPHDRKSIRLPGHDYASPGAYFITLCTHRREPIFGEVVDGDMRLNTLGEIVREEWERSTRIRREIDLDTYVIMSNHLHGIVWIIGEGVQSMPNVGATGRSPLPTNIPPHGPAPQSLGAFIAGFKSSATKRINRLRGTPGAPVWQRNYWEHVIRSDETLGAIRSYIESNPQRWHLDRYHPHPSGQDSLAGETWFLMRGTPS